MKMNLKEYLKKKEEMVKSCLKYCGGKSKLLKFILANLPKEFKNYYEPFVGGASVVLGIVKDDLSKDRDYTISDINGDLMNCYQVIKNNVQELITELKDTEKYKNEFDVYYINRTRYNTIKEWDSSCSVRVERAALFIYLNKCCFNGMHRQNKKGEFNVPFGRMKNPIICDTETLLSMSTVFENINITCGDYKNTLSTIKGGDFVYLDPPYHGLFTDYTKEAFGEDNQRQLKEYIDNLTKKGVHVMMSNSATDFIRNLYVGYNTINLTTKYSIGGKNADRGEKQEILVTNY
jgi:DNA adenine methylase